MEVERCEALWLEGGRFSATIPPLHSVQSPDDKSFNVMDHQERTLSLLSEGRDSMTRDCACHPLSR
jgi:hypothetical protein